MPKSRGGRAREESFSDDEPYGLDDDFDDKKKEIISDEEVYGFGDSDDLGDDDLDQKSSEDENDDFDMGSDINEEDEKLPDDRAWGKRNRYFYNTDYVDQDYDGFYEGKEAEEAELEEQEARQIQKRLIEQLNETDFAIVEPVSAQPDSERDAIEEIQVDVSKLSTRQKLDLLQKESPEFFVLVQDFKNSLHEIDAELLPVLNYFEQKQESNNAVKFIKRKVLILTNYCTNISFYLMLKAKRISVENHPVLKSLYKYRKLLEQMHEVDEVLKPQIKTILKAIKDGGEEVIKKMDGPVKKDRKILKLLMESKTNYKNKKSDTDFTRYEKQSEEDDTNSIDDKVDAIGNVLASETGRVEEKKEKRAITYEMAKNKGLMPKRNKDQRNPRVKHRKKYRKALIRRRGQVRTARSEIPVYGGEPTGIKTSVTKSIKFK